MFGERSTAHGHWAEVLAESGAEEEVEVEVKVEAENET